MKPKHSAAKLFSPDNTSERNMGIALFGDVVWTKRQQAIIKLVGLFEKVGSYDRAKQKISRPFCERKFDRFRPLLFKALLKQDATLFKEFANAIEAAKRIKKAGPVHPLEAELIRMEGERKGHCKSIVDKNDVSYDDEDEVKGRLLTLEKTNPPPMDNTELNDTLAKRLLDCPDKEQVRRAAKRLGIPLKSGKLGAPKKVRRITRRQNRS